MSKPSHDELVLNYKISLVTEKILGDQRITKVRTAVNICKVQFGWTQDEADRIGNETTRLIKEAHTSNKNNKFLTCYKAFTYRINDRRSNRR